MSAATLTTGLGRLRRRAGLLAAAQMGAPAGVAVFGALLAARTFALVHPGFAIIVGAPAAAVMLGAAVGWTRRPSLLSAARHADAASARQATLVTALEVRDARDPFAARVLDEGVSVLAGLDAARVYPWRWTRPAAVLAALGGVLLVASLVTPAAREDAAAQGGVGDGADESAGSVRAQTARPAPSAADTRTATSRPASSAPAATPAPAPPVDNARDARSSTPPEPTPGSGSQISGALEARTPNGAAAGTSRPGGATRGQLGSAGTAGVAAPAGSAGTGISSFPVAPAARAAALEHVPMNRRAIVRRYLLAVSGPEPR